MNNKSYIPEFFIGGFSAVGAGIFTNPLDVIKTRFQLQGELKIKGNYNVYYKNIFHSAYTIARTESIFALQKGLVPALYYQFVMNGVRFGIFQCFDNSGFLKDKNGKVSFSKTLMIAAVSGTVASGIGSPFYMIKTQLQSKAAKEIAVGHQHSYDNMSAAVKNIYSKYGIFGLWRGSLSAIMRTTVGSSAQLTFFTQSRFLFERYGLIEHNNWLSNLSSAFASGICVTIFMTPFDVVLTRLYNQPRDPQTGKGLLYKGLINAAIKIFKIEGIHGLYKGYTASLARQVPHTVLNLFFWQELRKIYYNVKK